ncbi:hypothetical protein VTJ83DRAFT_1718 [Remersonia thermophila]|uniref:Proteophosphoglycan ppg4 n=1 Tax=Remersonia thermophila TaxID=72144 RepID=A0ABR4DJ13_9PEZI
MGNAQSNEASRRKSHRLSKPKTGNPANSGLRNPGFSSSTSRRRFNDLLPNPPAPSPTSASTSTTTSPADAFVGPPRQFESVTSLHSAPGPQKESKRRSLLLSWTSRDADPTLEEGFGTAPGPRMFDRLSRSNSTMTYEAAVAYYGQAAPESRLTKSESRVSWNYNMMSYEAKRLLHLVDDTGLEQAGTMSENRMTSVSENTWNMSNPAQPSNAPLSRTNSDVSLYMPVRRRSMIQTPGVATRSSPDPELPPLSRPNVRNSHPPTPSLSRQHSVESYRSGIVSMPPRLDEPEPAQRVMTPCEDKYQSIGAYKLGSLRITNGSPPMTPDNGKDRAGEASRPGRLDALRNGYFPESKPSEAGERMSTETGGLVQSPGQLHPASPALQTTSKPTALEACLFDDEAQPEYSSVEVLDVRLDPNAKPPHAEVARNKTGSVERTDSGFVSTMTSPASDTLGKSSLTKADSGYSSNVSLRSFQSKGRKHEEHIEEKEPAPPPVPPKDPIWARASQANSDGVGRNPAHDGRRGQTGQADRSSKPSSTPITSSPPHSRGPASPLRDLRSPMSVKSSSSGHSSSVLSIGGTSKKPNRLQRFLGGARKPIVDAPATQPANVPGHTERTDRTRSPQDHLGQQKPEASLRASLTATRRFALNPRPSKETLGTIFSVGSLEAKSEQIDRTASAADLKDVTQKLGANPVVHTIRRKPVPSRSESTQEKHQGDQSNGKAGSMKVTTTADHSTSIRSPTSKERRLSTSGAREPPVRSVSEIDLSRVTASLPSPPLPSPVAKALAAEGKKTFHPVRTPRRPVSLRVPPPLRPSSIAGLSRRTSVESVRSQPVIHSRPSLESMRSSSSNQFGVPTGGGTMLPRSASEVWMADPRRLEAFRHNQSNPSSPYYSEGWEVQTDYGGDRPTSLVYPTSSTRRNSISSVHSEGGYGSAAWSYRMAQPPLRHRTSFDNSQPSFPHPRRGYPPSMSNGYTAEHSPYYNYSQHSHGRAQLDIAAAWSRAQAVAAAGQRYQDGGQPPYVPPGQYRNRRAYDYGYRPPYRVLHSYNSPAYRNAPIWG